MQVSYAIVFVSDMKRSVTFYRDVLGLPLKFETPMWTEFATGGATLALHASHEPSSGSDGPASEPPGRCRPGFQVADLAEFHRTVTSRGVQCVQEPKESFGVRIAQYTDPDGLVISVSEEPPAAR